MGGKKLNLSHPPPTIPKLINKRNRKIEMVNGGFFNDFFNKNNRKEKY